MPESLPRRPFFGIRFGPSPIAHGLVVDAVVPGSIAAEAALVPGDRVLRIGSIAIDDEAALAKAIRAIGGASEVELTIERAGERCSRVAPVTRWPSESIENAEVSYETLERGGVRLRLIVTSPSHDPAPAILIVQGIGAGSIDFGASPDEPLAAMIRAFSAHGLATVRIDKRGVGDSEGEIGGFTDELEDARAALIAGADHRAVDRERIAIFGHSVGGMIAPLLASEGIARAIAVYGTSSERWLAGLEASARRQLLLRGVAPEEVDRRLENARSLPWYLRSEAFHRELDAVDLRDAWSRVRVPVLALHGEHDWVVSREEHLDLAALVPGARFEELPGLDHLFTRHSDLAASLRAYGAGAVDPAIAQAVAEFVLRSL
jgi:pimeloyl-ACP methyl ester carboxylesterase